jgi:hypothetical protein
MVIRNVIFEGWIRNSSLIVKVDEQYCALRIGTWRFKVDSIAFHLPKATVATAVLGCSLLTSQQQVGQQTCLSHTPLHVVTVYRTLVLNREFPVKTQLIAPGQIQEWQYFNDGSQQFYLSFREVGPRVPPLHPDRPDEEPLVLQGVFVTGVLMFEFISK